MGEMPWWLAVSLLYCPTLRRVVSLSYLLSFPCWAYSIMSCRACQVKRNSLAVSYRATRFIVRRILPNYSSINLLNRILPCSLELVKSAGVRRVVSIFRYLMTRRIKPRLRRIVKRTNRTIRTFSMWCWSHRTKGINRTFWIIPWLEPIVKYLGELGVSGQMV